MSGKRAFEYIVTIRDAYVSSIAFAGNGSKFEVPAIGIRKDALRDSTIKVLQDWLDRWGRLTELDPDNLELPVLATFEVIGKYLYELAFPEAIAINFVKVYEEAKRNDGTLHVSLRFEGEDAELLSSYPWEFLYGPAGDDGSFIGMQTSRNLVLSRDISDERWEVWPQPPPLKVMFIVAMPECDEFRDERATLIDMSYKLRLTSGSLWKEVITSWDKDEIVSTASSWMPHVIHIFGVCRGTGKQMRIALRANDAGEPLWDLPNNFVEGLKSTLLGNHTPRLVVLHLCQARTIDYAATFGLLAPEVVKAGFPAVLAMQYPLPVNALTTDFAANFYSWLQDRDGLGAAVQKARAHLGGLNNSHLFGAPVLYLQSDDVVVLDPPSISSSGAGANVGAVRIDRASGRSKLDRILDASTRDLDPIAAAEITAFVQGLAELTPAEITAAISNRVKMEDSDKRKKALYATLIGFQKASMG